MSSGVAAGTAAPAPARARAMLLREVVPRPGQGAGGQRRPHVWQAAGGAGRGICCSLGQRTLPRGLFILNVVWLLVSLTSHPSGWAHFVFPFLILPGV